MAAFLVEIVSRFVVEFVVLLAGPRLAAAVFPLEAFELGRRPRSEARSLLLAGLLCVVLCAALALSALRLADGDADWLLAAFSFAMGAVGLACLGLSLAARLGR